MIINVIITCCLFIMGANVPRLGDDDLQSPCGGFDTHCLHNEFEKLSRFGIVT